MSSSGTRLAQCLACFPQRTSSDADCSKQKDRLGQKVTIEDECRWILNKTCTAPLISPPVPVRFQIESYEMNLERSWYCHLKNCALASDPLI